MTDNDTRLALVKAYERIGRSNTVGLGLGVWAGRGAWASTSAAYRDSEGRRALTNLDALIARLTEFRQQLAAALPPDAPGDR
jgi:hypothetical protein